MKIAIIGAGNVGGTLGAGWAKLRARAGWRRPMSISGGLVRPISEGSVRRAYRMPDEGGHPMGAKTEALARQFEDKARDAVTTLEKLGDADWKKVTAAEKWTVGVTAHHLAGGLEAVASIVTGLLSEGTSRGNFTRAMLDEMNAQHAKEHAHFTRTETIALFRKGAATASAVVRGLNDDQLAKSGTVFTDAPPMTAEQLIMLGLLGHIDDHMGSIRKTVGM